MKTVMVFTLIFGMGLLMAVPATPDEIAAVKGKLPIFKAQNLLNNKEIDLAKLNGHVLIVDFWATWCMPCKKEIPEFIELYKQYKEKQFTILGISVDAKQKDAEKFIEKRKITYPIVMVSKEIQAAFEKVGEKPIRGIPTAFIFDREGNLVSTHVGYTKKEVFLKQIKPLLEKEVPKAEDKVSSATQ